MTYFLLASLICFVMYYQLRPKRGESMGRISTLVVQKTENEVVEIKKAVTEEETTPKKVVSIEATPKEQPARMRAVRCSGCGASLLVEEGKTLECEYCGTFTDAYPHGVHPYADKLRDELENKRYELEEALSELEDKSFELEMTLSDLEDRQFDLEMAMSDTDDALYDLDLY